MSDWRASGTATGVAVLAAAALWCVLFSPWTQGWVNFWLGMTLAAGLLTAAAVWLERRELRDRLHWRPVYLAVGLVSAALLYALFVAGDRVGRAILPFAGDEIAAVYARRDTTSPVLIGALLFAWIGPAEEIFWRGFLQHRLARRWGGARGYLLAGALYAAVHLWAGNLMLFLSALLCGLFWGAVYRRWGSLWPGILSHAVWDVLVFVIAPI